MKRIKRDLSLFPFAVAVVLCIMMIGKCSAQRRETVTLIKKDSAKVDIKSPLTVDQKIDQINLKLDRYANKASVGKGMELLGFIALSGSVIIQAKNANKSNLTNNDLQTPKTLAIVGASVFAVGLWIDLDAGHILLKKK